MELWKQVAPLERQSGTPEIKIVCVHVCVHMSVHVGSGVRHLPVPHLDQLTVFH